MPRRTLIALLLLAVILQAAPVRADNPPYTIYLPLASHTQTTRQINLPYFADGEITTTRFGEMAIAWFGQVRQSENSIDVRAAYNDNALWIYLAIFDRRLWYDPTPDDLLAWDAAVLSLELSGQPPSSPQSSSWRFLAQLTPQAQPSLRLNYQQAYTGQNGTWTPSAVTFHTASGWRGDAINNNTDDRGWAMTFIIPFESLGLDDKPAEGALWRIGLQVFDRDESPGSMAPTQSWPHGFDAGRPASWAGLRFGLPGFSPPGGAPSGSVTIRHRLNGITVEDGSAGGYTICGNGTDFWTEWGDTPDSFYNPTGGDYNVQNQSDVADWPCFSRVYLRFPLNVIPPGKRITGAQLTLHQFGQSGAPGDAQPSLIQVLTVDDAWQAAALTWNNAPAVQQNVSRAWVDPISVFPGWPGVSRTWDVAYAVDQAYRQGQPFLSLALYSADAGYHSGKYFVSSLTGDWNAAGRPTLTVSWTEP